MHHPAACLSRRSAHHHHHQHQHLLLPLASSRSSSGSHHAGQGRGPDRSPCGAGAAAPEHGEASVIWGWEGCCCHARPATATMTGAPPCPPADADLCRCCGHQGGSGSRQGGNEAGEITLQAGLNSRCGPGAPPPRTARTAAHTQPPRPRPRWVCPLVCAAHGAAAAQRHVGSGGHPGMAGGRQGERAGQGAGRALPGWFGGLCVCHHRCPPARRLLDAAWHVIA